jgi:hypothetical protein
MAWQVYNAGADALIIQDMGLLELDLPPIQLHASTQTDIRTPEKARFLQDCGLSQIVLARELTVQQIAAVRAATGPAALRHRVLHPRRAVRGLQRPVLHQPCPDRPQRQPGRLQPGLPPALPGDGCQGRIVAHDKHVLSMKDNNQSDNLRALIDAGVRSFKIEGRYKDMGYVKNITAHYRKLLDGVILDEREASGDPLARASSGRTTFTFTPDPLQNFNREFTDYFVNGRKDDIGAFDTPKNPGQAIGWVTKLGPNLGRAGSERPGHRAAQRRRPVLLRPAKGTGGPADQPGRARVAARRPKASGACSPKTRWRASRTCARAPRSTATATWTGCARWRRSPATGASPCGRSSVKRRTALPSR